YVLLAKSISYEPGEAVATLKGGNSNWRGPIWFPTSFLLLDSLKKLEKFTGNNFKIKDSENNEITAGDMAKHFAESLKNLFRKNKDGERPMFGDCKIMQKNEHWNNCLLFYEHFHGDTGRGLGAMHQTGWTGLIAN